MLQTDKNQLFCNNAILDDSKMFFFSAAAYKLDSEFYGNIRNEVMLEQTI